MVRFAIARKVWLAFFVAALSLAVLTAACWRTVSFLIESSQWVAHTEEVIAAINELGSQAERAETTQRGAILTGQRRYELAYARAKAVARDSFDRIARLTTDNPAQESNVAALGPVLARRFAVADAVLARARRDGLAAGAAAIRGGSGDRLMADISRRIVEMRQEEEQFLVERRTQRERTAGQALAAIIAFGAVALLLVGLGTRAILLDLERRVALEEEISRFFELSVDLLCIADYEGRFVRLNPSWETLLGMPRTEMLGRPFLDLVHPDDRERTLLETARLRSGVPTIGFENRYRRADGAYRVLRWTAAASPDTRQFYAVARDLTAVRAVEELKTEVAHHVNHELRSPVAALKMGLRMVADELETRLAPSQRSALEISLRSVSHLQRMIEDLLDVTRSETGKLRVEPESIDLHALLLDCVGSLNASAASKGVRLAFEPAREELTVRADPTRLRQVVGNLLDNALKFTPREGQVELSAERWDKDPSFCIVSVADSGPGIPPEDVDRVFERLYQTARTAKSGSKGLGLGLAICRELVERQGGKIWAENRPEGGARLSFTLPLA